jgi:hypothetical protein
VHAALRGWVGRHASERRIAELVPD